MIATTDLNCGAYSEYISLPEDGVIVKQPENTSPEEATGIVFDFTIKPIIPTG